MVANYAPDVGYAWWLMEHYWCLLAEDLARRGRSALLAYPKRGEVPVLIREAPIEVIWLNFGDRSAAGRQALASTVRHAAVESVYLTDRPYIDSTYYHLRRLGVRKIAMHDHRPGDRPAVTGLKGWVKGRLRRAPLWSPDVYVAVTEFVRERMIRNARTPQAATFVVPNGVVSMDYSRDDRAWARQSLGVGDDEIVVGMVGRAHRIKGIEFAMQAADEVLRREPRALFVFVGDGPDLERFRAKAVLAGIGSRFRFLGRRTDVRRLMAGFDMGLHPSAEEVGYCLAILEMMNAGRPVIVPDLPSVRGATEDGVTGLWYRADDTATCAAAILQLVANTSVREQMGVTARERTLTRFSLYYADRSFLDNVASRL